MTVIDLKTGNCCDIQANVVTFQRVIKFFQSKSRHCNVLELENTKTTEHNLIIIE